MTEILSVVGPFAFFGTAIAFAIGCAARRRAMRFEYLMGGAPAGLGIVYLVYVLIWPEKF